MSFLDIFFGKKKNKKKKEEIKKEENEIQQELKEGSIICDYCKEEIFSHEPRTKIEGKSHHRRCLKKIKKQAKKMLFG